MKNSLLLETVATWFGGKNIRSEDKQAWVQIFMSLISCVTLDKLLNLSDLVSSSMKQG